MECATARQHKVAEVARYRPPEDTAEVRQPTSKGFGAPHQCSRDNEHRSGWGELSLASVVHQHLSNLRCSYHPYTVIIQLKVGDPVVFSQHFRNCIGTCKGIVYEYTSALWNCASLHNLESSLQPRERERERERGRERDDADELPH